MIYRLLILIIGLLITTSSVAKAQKHYELEAKVGGSYGALRDERIASFNFSKDFGVDINLLGRYYFKESQIGLLLGYGGNLLSSNHYWSSTYRSIDLALNYLRDIDANKLIVSLGGEYNLNSSFEPRGSYIITHNFSPIIALKYDLLPRHKLELSFSFALWAFVIRYPYNGVSDILLSQPQIPSSMSMIFDTLKRTEFATLDRYNFLKLNIGYRYRLNSTFDFAIRYKILYQSYYDENLIKHFSNGCQLSVIYKLK